MAITTVYTYPLNGSKQDFSVPFEYLARRFVSVTLIGVAGRRKLVLTTDYRFTSSTNIRTNAIWAPSSGYSWIEIRRETSASDRLVDFTDGSILRASDMNVSQVQTLHVAEEARNAVTDTIGTDANGNLDARARRIVNVADAVDPGDAVNLHMNQQWAGSALNQANLSAQSAAASQTSRLASEAARDLSANYANASQTSRLASEAARDTAGAHKDAAASSASNAASSAQTAYAWSSTTEDVQVSPGLFSAFHWARKALASAAAAALSVTQAAQKVTDATAQVSLAKTQADRAASEADRATTQANALGGMNDLAMNVDASGTTTGTGNWKVSFKGILKAIGKVFAKKYEAQGYDEGTAFVNQTTTEAPFFVKSLGLTSASEYRPIIKARVNINGGADEAVSLGVLSYPNAKQEVILHWAASGTGGPLMQWSREANSVVVPGTFTANGGLYDAGSRVWTAATFNPASKLAASGATTVMGNMNSVCGVNYQNLSAANQVYNGAFEIRENGLVQNGGAAPGHIYNAPAITFHWGSTAVNKLMMNSAGSLCWGNPAGDPVRIDASGIIYGSAYGGTLSGWVDANYTPRGSFAAQAVASINAGTLGNVAFLYNQSGATQGNNAVLGGGSLQWTSHNAVGGVVGGGSWRCNGWTNNGGCTTWQRIA